jgi:hypothetical protein
VPRKRRRERMLLRALPVSRWAVYGGIALAVLLIVGVVCQQYWPDLRWIAAPESYEKPLPRTAMKTKTITKLVPQVVTKEVVVYRPSPKQKEEIERHYDLKLDEVGKQILTEVDTGKLTHGGTALVTLNERGEAEVKIAPKRAPFAELGGDTEIGAGAVYHSGFGLGARIHGAKDLGRIWRVTVKVEGDLDIYGGRASTTGAVLGVIRF